MTLRRRLTLLVAMTIIVPITAVGVTVVNLIGNEVDERAYDRLRQGILDIVVQGHIRLIETLGGRIVEMCFVHPQVDGVHLQIVKVEAHGDCEVGYETRRRR